MDALAEFAKPDFRRDPYPFLRWLRENEPVHRTSAGFYLVSRHADAACVQRGTGEVFLGPDRARLVEQYASALRHPSMAFRLDAMLLKNPPEHTRLRRLVAKAFTPKHVAGLNDRIGVLCDELIDDVTEPLRQGEVVDLHARLAVELTLGVIAELIGVPAADRAWLAAVVTDFVAALGSMSEDLLLVADKHTEMLEGYFLGLIDERRRTPAADLLSALVTTDPEAPERLSDDEIVSMLLTLWIAGFETTAAGIDHGVLTMLDHPGHNHWLTEDPAAFTEEVLRRTGPGLFTPVPRIATRPVRLSDVELPTGSDVRPVFAAANRDPDVFPDPDAFDPARDTSRSLAFGHGIHHCLGAFLAQAEIRIALTRLHTRFPGLAPAGEPVWGNALPMHAPSAVPVALAL
ncbi:cytochrome P450 [Kutzneria sp. CA-103260]|uniref:cytochrome P450 n=1 Tax=Kutzneria sp. CA-103260 TaxID=2802641 RepID=UPI001BAA8664|nr:cytochrome P450 [Kutzneria sp. CA-103260]QUQ65534.1 cytochrome P450 [Kutzneria sp. CA-103260]